MRGEGETLKEDYRQEQGEQGGDDLHDCPEVGDGILSLGHS